MKLGKFILPLVLLAIVLFGATCYAAECPVEVKAKRNGIGKPVIAIVSTVDSVTVQNVVINRGNVKIAPKMESVNKPRNGEAFIEAVEVPRFPFTLKFGEESNYIEYMGVSSPREIEIQTNLGNWTFTFK